MMAPHRELTGLKGYWCIVTFCLVLVSVAAPFPCAAQQQHDDHSALPEASPESVGMSSDRLARIDDMLEEAIEKQQIPGAVALVARNGKIVYHKAFGHANARGKKLRKDHIFRLASQTKSITATALMTLWEEGKFQLDDPISKFIPEFKDPQVLESFNPLDSSFTTRPAKGEITIRHLLTHTSGIGYVEVDFDERFRKIYHKAGLTPIFTGSYVTIEEDIRKLARLPLHHDPGEKFTYSMGQDVIGYLIEILSGESFNDFLITRIFDPLQMRDTRFYFPDNAMKRLVSVQIKKDDSWEDLGETFYDPDYPVRGSKTFYSGGGGLSGTALDYAMFLQMYLNDGKLSGTRILSRTTIETIMGNHSGILLDAGKKYYGLAFAVVTAVGEEQGGLGSEGTFDWGGYFNTEYFADPVENVIGVLLKQTSGNTGDDTDWKFRQIIFSSIDN